MADDRVLGLWSFLEGIPSPAREQAHNILAACPAVDVEGAAPRSAATFARATLLLVADGFVVLRASVMNGGRGVVTCDAGPGSVLLPPAAEEELLGLGSAQVLVIDSEIRRQLLETPVLAERVAERLALTLREGQEAASNFGLTRHIERVRRKLLQLAIRYGRVVADGVRIDFPVSHALLAEMIGSSRETVTRAVDELQRRRFVARRGSTYRLLVSPESILERAQR